MNRLHAMVSIQKIALEDGDIDEKTIYGKTRKLFDTSGDKALMSREEVEQFAKQSIHQVKSAKFPVERARLALDVLEGGIRADVLDAIAQLDISKPGDCRDVFELHSKVAGSIGEPTIREALDMLAAGGIDTADLTARCDALFPKDSDDSNV